MAISEFLHQLYAKKLSVYCSNICTIFDKISALSYIIEPVHEISNNVLF